MLGHLPRLRELYLAENKLETLFTATDSALKKGLNGCPNLEVLDLSTNLLRDFNGLQYCMLKELKKLYAENNEIARIDNL
jgi:Leucine-rich repeat (LRR) protein